MKLVQLAPLLFTFLSPLACSSSSPDAGEPAPPGNFEGAPQQDASSVDDGGRTTLDAGDASIDVHADFFVSPDGNDSWSGALASPNATKTDGPFQTLTKAQSAVAKISKTARATPIVVVVRGGTYTLDAPWTFTAADSGTATAPVHYSAYPGEAPVVSGGIVVKGWTESSPGRWTTNIPKTADFEQLWVDGQRRYRPRANGGNYEQFGASPSDNVTTSFHYVNATDLSSSWFDLSSTEIVAFEAWTSSRQRLVSVDAATKTATTTAMSSLSSTHGYIPNHRYLVDNVKEMLGTPGDWYLDRLTVQPGDTHQLTYDAKSGENPNTNVVVMPNVSQLIVATGLTHTSFDGLTFSYTNWTVPTGGYGAGQALWDVPAALSFVDTSSVVLDGCRVTHVGASGVEFEGNGGWTYSAATPYSNEFVNGEISDTGAGGVHVGSKPGAKNPSTNIVYSESTTAQGVHVANNILTGGGRFLHSAMAILIGESHHNVIEHNEISDFYQTGISIGFTFASIDNGGTSTYPSSLAHDETVRYNLIHDIGRGVLNDMGGIYLLTSESTGNVVDNNVIHDVVHDPGAGPGFAAGYGGNGLYFDQGTSNVIAENNLVYRTTGSSFQQNQGRSDVLKNNIFAFGRESSFEHTYWEANKLWATFENNIVLYDQGTLLSGNWVCAGAGADCRGWVDFHDNLYSNAAGSVSFRTSSPSATYTLTSWQADESEDLGSAVGNPLFVNPNYPADNFTLQAASPAPAIGFVAFDPTLAGRTAPTMTLRNVPAAVPLQEPANVASFY